MPVRHTFQIPWLLLLIAPLLLGIAQLASASEGPAKIVLLPPGPGNPRNSEGDFIQLNDGRILFVYTHFTGGGDDHSAAHLAGRYSSDGGLKFRNLGKPASIDARLLPGKVAALFDRTSPGAEAPDLVWGGSADLA